MSKIKREFGARLEKIIQAEWGRGGKKKLAELLNVPQNTLSTWLSGRIPDDPEYLVKIADVFGVTVDYLLTGKSPWEKGIYVDGKRVAEDSVGYQVLEATPEEVAKVRAVLDLIRAEVSTKIEESGNNDRDADDNGNKPSAKRKAC